MVAGDEEWIKFRCLLMTQSEIAEASGLSQQHISRILNGDRQPSLETAEKLEKATGMCRESWLFPERHWTPYIPFSKQNSCLACKNRAGRSKWVLDRCCKYLNQAEKKMEAVKVCLDGMLYVNGFDNNVSLGIRYWDGEWFRLVVGSTGSFRHKPKFHRDEIPFILEHLEEEKPFVVSHTLTMPETPEKKMFIKGKVTSLLGVNSGRVAFGMLTYGENLAIWTEEIVDAVQEWCCCLRDNLQELGGL